MEALGSSLEPQGALIAHLSTMSTCYKLDSRVKNLTTK